MKIYIFNTLFSNNYAKSSTNFGGGAIYAQLIDGDKQIINCTFKNNRASAGGAILIQQSRGILNIENSTFIENTATGSERYGGGAIALVGETYSASGYASSIKNSIFYNNSYLQSYGYGGAAVFTRHVNLNLTNSILAFNHDEAYNKTVYKFIGGT